MVNIIHKEYAGAERLTAAQMNRLHFGGGDHTLLDGVGRKAAMPHAVSANDILAGIRAAGRKE